MQLMNAARWLLKLPLVCPPQHPRKPISEKQFDILGDALIELSGRELGEKIDTTLEPAAGYFSLANTQTKNSVQITCNRDFFFFISFSSGQQGLMFMFIHHKVQNTMQCFKLKQIKSSVADDLVEPLTPRRWQLRWV